MAQVHLEVHQIHFCSFLTGKTAILTIHDDQCIIFFFIYCKPVVKH